MTTTLGLMSDLHATPAPVEQALSVFQKQNVDHIFCLGDIAGYGDDIEKTVSVLEASQCESILGNHEQWYLDGNKTDAVTEYFKKLPRIIKLIIEDKKVYLVHASPPDSLTEGIRLLDEHGKPIEDEMNSWRRRLSDFDHDVLIVGHTHQVYAETLSSALVINPGSTAYNHSCAVLTLPDMTVQWFSLSGKQIVKAWNWGMNVNRMNGDNRE